MKNTTFSKILFVINPTSGTSRKVDYSKLISQYAGEYNFSYEIYTTTGEDDKNKIHNRIDAFHPETVIAVGGDGTINNVATLLIGTNINLGIIPSGSANGLAYNLNLPTQFEEALKKNLEGPFKPMDVILINNEHYCLHLSDLGINARIVKRFEREGSKGLLGYGKQLIKELIAAKSSFSFTLKTDESQKRTKAEMVVIANASSYGTGIEINPYGKLDDGKFELVIIKPYPWWYIFIFIYRSFRGNLHKLQHVNVYKTSYAEVEVDEYQDFQIDGEIKDKTKSLKMEVVKHALKVSYVR